jgi:hypothetical protein
MKHLTIVLLAGLVASGCGGSSSSPVSPSPGSLTTLSSVGGTWSGSSADSSGQEQMVWTVAQDGSNVTGTMSFSDTGRGMLGNGSMRGSVNGRTVTFHMDVPNGGFSGMRSSCSMDMDGQATISDDGHTMTGTYSGNMSGMMSQMQSCGDAMNNGRFTLTR